MGIEISRGGRVKAAGLSFAIFTDPAAAYLGHPNAKNAAEMIGEYAAFRKSPSEAVRNRFFPRDPTNAGTIKNGGGLSRTSLKNDQGVGTFLTHQISSDVDSFAPLRADILQETGFTIVEAHLVAQLTKLDNPKILDDEITVVKKFFAVGDLAAAQAAYEKLIQAGKVAGVNIQRDAAVGREGLFFIHPSIPKIAVKIDTPTHDKMKKRGERLVEQMIEIASKKRDEFAEAHDLSTSYKRDFPPIYFQIDFLIDRNRTTHIADVGLPDVGFFLAGLDDENNQTVRDAKHTVVERLEDTALAIQKKISEHGSKTVCFITRKGVLENDEDTLEIKEILVLKGAVEALGCISRVISVQDALQMAQDELGIFMNVDTSSPAFQTLLTNRVRDESVVMYPDPFLLLAKHELTDLPQISLQRDDLDLLIGIFKSTERASGIEKSAVQLAAVEQIIERSGIPSDCDILHMYIPGQPTPVAFYKYDLRGLEIALKYAFEAQAVNLRGIPVNPDSAVLFDPKGKPMFTTFRYMFNQK